MIATQRKRLARLRCGQAPSNRAEFRKRLKGSIVSDGFELWLRRTGFWWLICFGAAFFSLDHEGWMRFAALTVALVALGGGLLGTWWLIRSPEPSAAALDRLEGVGQETDPVGGSPSHTDTDQEAKHKQA